MRCTTRSSGWTRAVPTCDPAPRRRPRCASRATTRASSAVDPSSPAASRRAPGKDPVAHILWLQRTRARDRARDVEVPRAEGLVEPQAHRGRAATYDSIVLHWVTDNRDLAHVAYDDGLLGLVGRRRARAARSGAGHDGHRRTADATSRASSGCRRASRSSAAPPTSSPPRSARARCATSRATSTSARRRGSPATCRSRRPTSCANIASLPSPLPGRYFVANEQEVAGRCAQLARATTCCIPTMRCARRRFPTTSSPRIDALAASAPAGQRRRDLHAVAQRRAHAGRRPPTARRLAQPLAAHRPGRPGPLGARGRRAQLALAARRRREVRRAGRSTALNFVGGGAQSACGARSSPTCSTGPSARSRTRAGQRARRGVARRRRRSAASRSTTSASGRDRWRLSTRSAQRGRVTTRVRRRSSTCTSRTRASTRGSNRHG